MGLLTGILSTVGTVVGGFFGFKKEQAKTIQSAVDVVGSSLDSDAAQSKASAEAIAALYQSGPPIERLWRPTFMWVILALVVARWFGYVPPHIPQEEIAYLYNFLEMGLIGYLPLRSVDKWIKGFQIGNVLKTFIEKKLG